MRDEDMDTNDLFTWTQAREFVDVSSEMYKDVTGSGMKK